MLCPASAHKSPLTVVGTKFSENHHIGRRYIPTMTIITTITSSSSLRNHSTVNTATPH